MARTNYSGTRCPKCEKTSFEVVDDAPSESTYRYSYLRCSSCKTFLAAFDFDPVGAIVAVIKADVKEIKKKLPS